MMTIKANNIIFKNAHPAAVFPTFGTLVETTSGAQCAQAAKNLLTKIDLVSGCLQFAGIKTSAVYSVEEIKVDERYELLVVTKSGSEYRFELR